MFRENHRHEQGNFFNTVGQLPRGIKKKMVKSWAPGFRDLVFQKIDERRYAELHSDIDSRPNFPVNVWVGLEVIKGMFDYTDAELLEQFNIVEGGKEIKVEVKPSREISARSLQNPADDTATCRTKDGRIY